MPASQPATFNLQEFTDAGLLLVGGRLYTYAYGTTNQKIAYTDPAGTVPHTYTADGAGGQYIALNARGELPAPLYLATGSYDLALKRGDGSTIWTRKADGVDNLPNSWAAAIAASTGSALIGNGGETVADSFNALQMASYAVLRAYTGPRKSVYITGILAATVAGINGMFIRDDADVTSADNGGTIIVAANGKRWKRSFSGPVDAQWFGYVADYNGVAGTDNAAAINLANAAVNNGGTISFPRGAALTLSTIYIPYGVSWIGAGMQHTPDILAPTAQGTMIVGKHAGAATVSLKGAYADRITGMVISGHPATPPKTGLCLGRSSAASAGRHSFTDVNVVGWFTRAAIYSIASEENVWVGLRGNVLGGGAPYTFFTAEGDSLGVDAMTTSSNFTGYLYGFNLLHQADYSASGIPSCALYIEATTATATWRFDGGFIGVTSQCTGSSFMQISLNGASCVDISFENIGCEAVNSANPPLQVLYVSGPGRTLKGLRVNNVSGGQVQSGQQYFIKAQGGVFLDNADIHCSKTDHPTSLSGVRNSRISIPDQDVTIEASIGNTLNARQLYLPAAAVGTRSNNMATSPVFGPVGFGGAGGVNDMIINPTSLFSGTVVRNYVVAIDATTAPNTFKWSNDGGATWVATGVAITGAAQLLSEGVVIKFVATTGHTLAAQWSFRAEPNVVMG